MGDYKYRKMIGKNKREKNKKIQEKKRKKNKKYIMKFE